MKIPRIARRGLLGLLLILPLGPLQAGDAMTIYSELTFVDVAPGQAAAFERGAAELIKPAQQQRIDEGGLFAWALYALEYGSAAHDYVLIRQAIDFTALTPPRLPPTLRETDAFGAWAATFEITERTLFDLGQFHTNLELRERPWLTLRYLRTRPGRAADFETVMMQQWEPALREWVASGDIAALSRYRVIQPESAARTYDQVLVMQYPEFGALKPDDGFARALARVRPDADLDAVTAALDATAETLGSETWRLVELARRGAPAGD